MGFISLVRHGDGENDSTERSRIEYNSTNCKCDTGTNGRFRSFLKLESSGVRPIRGRQSNLHVVVIVMESGLLGVVRSSPNIAVVICWSFLLLARCEHALQCDANSDDAKDGGPFIAKDRGADVSIRVNMGVDWCLISVADDELHGRR